MKRYVVEVHLTNGSVTHSGCDDVDLDSDEGTLTLYGTYAEGTVEHDVYMLRHVLRYTVKEQKDKN